MPYKDKEIEKVYWTIGEVAKQLNLTQSQLRFWETEFSTIQPKKNKKGDRFYASKDIEALKLIQHLLKERGFTIKGAKELLKKNTQKTEAEYQAITTLKKIRSFLVELKHEL